MICTWYISSLNLIAVYLRMLGLDLILSYASYYFVQA